MRKNTAFVIALVCLFVVVVTMYLKGDVTASVEALGVRMSIDAKDKRPSPTPTSLPTPATTPGASDDEDQRLGQDQAGALAKRRPYCVAGRVSALSRHIDPTYLAGFIAENDAGFQAVFRCTRKTSASGCSSATTRSNRRAGTTT